MQATSLTTLERIVSATRKEYEQGLKQALPGGVSGGPDFFFLTEGEVEIRIDIESHPDLVIALMRLPRLKATWHFVSGSDEAKADLLKRIDWSMKRGGG
ncbi:hypothetical protein [Marinobacterium sp. LSUCC0821]|uniref:hypothetical protein n=1 Tax=Marinobacterium sp. LSUCC0821 TaxID=2668067 RepID=UPI001451F4A1|nr:hypothetical protein [Marinobacterium sp. LSUCC0821]QJD71400.1 hypothetical protein HH196_06665 [Marinobacterium sp. LSUCC0821]